MLSAVAKLVVFVYEITSQMKEAVEKLDSIRKFKEFKRKVTHTHTHTDTHVHIHAHKKQAHIHTHINTYIIYIHMHIHR